MTRVHSVEDMPKLVGSDLGVTDWLLVEQSMINEFGRSTLDMDWLHVDPERARREGPFGGSIAFGFWTLSLLTHFSHQVGMWPKDALFALNYGLDRVRWTAPILVGSRIRMRCHLQAFEPRDSDRYLVRTLNTVELEDGQTALIAEWLGLFQGHPVRKIADPAQ